MFDFICLFKGILNVISRDILLSTLPFKPLRAAVVHLNFRAGSTFPVPVCTVPGSIDRTSPYNKFDAVRLYTSYRLTLLLLKGQREWFISTRLRCTTASFLVIEKHVQLWGSSRIIWQYFVSVLSKLNFSFLQYKSIEHTCI